MEQIHMSNPANMSSGSGVTSGVKGQQQSVADSMGMSQMGQDANGATNFKGLLQGEQLFPEMTEEQEQTVSLLAAEMQNMNNIMFLGMQSMQMQDSEKNLSIPENVAEGIINIGAMKLAQVGKVAEGQAAQNEVVQDSQNELIMPTGEEETVEGALTEKNSVDIQKEMSEGLPHQTETQTDKQLESVEQDAKEMANVSWQETTMKQQSVSDKQIEQPKAHDVIKADTPQEIPKNLAEKIIEKTNEGVREFEIQIEPKNLGKIAVKVEYQNGDATISIICSESKTLEIVKQNVNDISTVVQKNLQQETIVLVDEKRPEAYEQQQGNGNSDAGRESEWERQKEERKRKERSNANRFLQELTLGLLE